MATEDRNHDLGNALMVLEGATLTLARLRDELTIEQQVELAEAVAREAAEVRRLTAAEAAERAATRLDLRELVDRQAVMARANGVEVEVEGLDAAPVDALDGDIQQILHNLFSNARRHGRAGRDAPIRVRLVGRGDQVAVVVADEGPGVPAGIGDAVFTRGVRAGSEPGQGLGLAVSRRLARQHGGDLRLLPSADGEGARFELLLPAVEPATSA